MVQYRVIDRRLSAAQLINVFDDNTDQIAREVYRRIAQRIASDTPVDTGTYADSHSVGAGGRDGGFALTESAEGKPRRQPPGPYRAAAAERMLSQINALPKNAPDVMFRNNAIHAPFVEGRDMVFAKARRELSTAVDAALAALGSGRI